MTYAELTYEHPRRPVIRSIRASGDFTEIPVVASVPSTRPPEFVRVLQTGAGAVEWGTQTHLFTVESWSTTEENAFSMAQAALAALQDSSEFSRTRAVSGIYDSPDPQTDQFRYVFTVELVLRASTSSN